MEIDAFNLFCPHLRTH